MIQEDCDEDIQSVEQRIMFMTEQIRQKEDEIDQQGFVHSTEMKQLQLQLKDCKAENQLLKAEKESAKIAERDDTIDASMKSKSPEPEAKIRALQMKDTIISEMNEEITRAKEFVLCNKQVSISSLCLTVRHSRNSDDIVIIFLIVSSRKAKLELY